MTGTSISSTRLSTLTPYIPEVPNPPLDYSLLNLNVAGLGSFEELKRVEDETSKLQDETLQIREKLKKEILDAIKQINNCSKLLSTAFFGKFDLQRLKEKYIRQETLQQIVTVDDATLIISVTDYRSYVNGRTNPDITLQWGQGQNKIKISYRDFERVSNQYGIKIERDYQTVLDPSKSLDNLLDLQDREKNYASIMISRFMLERFVRELNLNKAS